MARLRALARIVLVAGLLATVLLMGTYLYFTSPAQVRARFLTACAERGIAVRSVGTVTYSAWSGLRFHDLELLVEGVPGAIAPHGASDEPAVWSFRAGRIELPLDQILRGNQTPDSVTIQGAALGLVRADWPTEGTGEPFLDWDMLHDLPRIIARDTELFLYEPAPTHTLRRRMRVDLDCRTTGSATILHLRQIGGSVGSNQGSDAPGLEVRYENGKLTGSVAALDVDLLDPLLPDSLRQRRADLRLEGRVACPHWSYDPRTGAAAAEVRLQSAALTLPLEPDQHTGERFVRLRDAQVTISTHGNLTDRRLAAVDCEAQADLRGAALTARLAIGEIDLASPEGFDPLAGPYDLELDIRELELPNASTFPAFVSSPKLHIDARAVLRKYDPHGKVNFRLAMSRAAPDAPRRFHGLLEALGPQARYIEFPYPVGSVRGTVAFSNAGIDLDLACRHGSGSITVRGHVNHSERWTGFALQIRGRNVPLDQELYAALPSEYQRLWDRAAPLGLADIDTYIDRDDGTRESGPLEERVRVDARLVGGSISFEDQRVTRSDALLRIRDGEIQIEDFHGYLGAAGIECRGTLRTEGQGGAAQQVTLRAANMRLDQDASDETQPFRYAGRGDVWGSIGGSGPDTYVIRLRGGTLLGGDDGAAGWTVKRGWVQRRDAHQQVIGLEAGRDERWVRIDSDLGRDMDDQGRIKLQAGDPEIARLLRQLVPEQWDHAREMLGLSGAGTIRLNFDELAAGAQAEVWLTADAMRPTPIPLPLENISAHALLREDGFDLYRATARCRTGGSIDIDGQGGWADGRQWTRIGVSATDLVLDRAFVGAMPEPLGGLLRGMNLEGQLRTLARRLQLERRVDGGWTAEGHLRFDDASLELGLPLTSFAGELRGSVNIPPAGDFEADALFVIERGTLSGRPIANWQGHLVRAAGSSQIRIDDLRGELSGGAISGTLELNPSSGMYAVEATLQSVRAASLLEPEADGQGRLSGVLDGHVFLRGDRDKPDSRVGGGTLRISEAPLSASRVTAEIAAVAQREHRQPLGDLIKQAEIRFAWEGQMVRLQRVELQTPRLRLIGSGAWNTRTDELQLTMVGATPEGLRLAVISDLIDTAGQELLQYRIRGTTRQPRVEIRPLHTITDPLRALLRGR